MSLFLTSEGTSGLSVASFLPLFNGIYFALVGLIEHTTIKATIYLELTMVEE